MKKRHFLHFRDTRVPTYGNIGVKNIFTFPLQKNLQVQEKCSIIEKEKHKKGGFSRIKDRT